ncbi:MAG: hypothetical protein HYZ01_12360 [Ignavibacteriales bacterium]|nr:hypothetical protein [Ignavibacteriales bacterium]
MKPETRIELIKMAEKAKRVQAEEYPRRWTSIGYVGAALVSLMGVFFMSSAIRMIVKEEITIPGTFFLLVALIITISPWYFIIRFNMNRNIELLCEAILSVNREDPVAAVSPAAPLLLPKKGARGHKGVRKTKK